MAHPVAKSSQTSRELYDQYLTSLSSDGQQAIQKVADAVGCVFTDDGQVNGSALAIYQNLILVPKHCFPFDSGKIVFRSCAVEAITYLDGENDPPLEFCSDFKILKIKDANLKPAPLSIESPMGSGVQINFRMDRKFYALPYESIESQGGYATRSDSINEITANGDSGGARCSLSSMAVSGIHQGQSEALTINQIYHVVEAILSNAQSEELQQRAWEVIKALEQSIVDITMLRMHYSPVYLQPGQVIPERHGLFQSRVITIDPIPDIPEKTIKAIFEFLDLITKDQEKKLDFFSKIPGKTDNIYRIPDYKNEVARIDRQVRSQNASNIQIQAGKYTLATVLVHDDLYNWAYKSGVQIQAAVINYVVLRFWLGLRRVERASQAIVSSISLIDQ